MVLTNRLYEIILLLLLQTVNNLQALFTKGTKYNCEYHFNAATCADTLHLLLFWPCSTFTNNTKEAASEVEGPDRIFSG